MDKSMFVRVATVIFSIVGVVHLYRAAQGIPVLFGMTVIPPEVSWVAGAFAILLAYAGYRHWR